MARYSAAHRPTASERFDPPRTHHARELRRGFARLLAEAVASSSVPAGRVVDLGCAGRSFEGMLLRKFDEYVGVDLAGNGLADVIVSPDGAVPLADDSADCVLSAQVIEHVADVPTYLEEARRILRPGGVLILSTNGHYSYHPDPVDLWRWTAEGLRHELTRAGFEVCSMRSVLSGPSAAVLLWQNTTADRLPGPVRRLYFWLCQGLIALLERRTSDRIDEDAVAFLAVAVA